MSMHCKTVVKWKAPSKRHVQLKCEACLILSLYRRNGESVVGWVVPWWHLLKVTHLSHGKYVHMCSFVDHTCRTWVGTGTWVHFQHLYSPPCNLYSYSDMLKSSTNMQPIAPTMSLVLRNLVLVYLHIMRCVFNCTDISFHMLIL